MLIEKTDNYVVLQSYASRDQNEFEVYDLNDNPLGYFIETFNKFSESQYEVYTLESTQFGDISHEEYIKVGDTTSFADAINFIVSTVYA